MTEATADEVPIPERAPAAASGSAQEALLAASVGRSLGRASRVATEWAGVLGGSLSMVLSRLGLRRGLTAGDAQVYELLNELAELVRQHSAQAYAALEDDRRFWNVVQQLHDLHFGPAPELAGEKRATATPEQAAKTEAKTEAGAPGEAAEAKAEASTSEGES
ncbi:MAG: hypothetical protein OEZ06_22225 [Myxococcales bacterium]|nr:hypothetical protein [Myxococcales bacterium]